MGSSSQAPRLTQDVPQGCAGAVVSIPVGLKARANPQWLSQTASAFAFLLMAMAQAALPEHENGLLASPISHCHPYALYQLWASFTWARDRTGMIKLLLVLLLLFLSLFMSPS